MTADRYDLLGDREGAAPFGSLERHVLEKMRDPINLGGLVPGANIDPDAERDRVDRVHAVGGHPQSVGQGRELRRHGVAPLRRFWRAAHERGYIALPRRGRLATP